MMHWFVSFIVLCLVAVSVASEDPSDVVTLDSETFASYIKSNPIVAVEFYSPWCGHCKSLAPEWEKAATELKDKVPVTKVDCTANQELCAEHGVQGYPTLKLFREGEPSSMEVARKSEAIVTYLTKELEPPVQILATQAAVETFLAANPIAALAYLDNDHDDRWTEFKTVALQKRHTLSFIAVLNADWSKLQVPALVLHRNIEEPKIVYTGEFTAAALAPWISRNLLPTLGEVNADTFPGYMAANLKTLGYLFVDPNDADTATFLKELEPKLIPYADDFVIAWINNNRYAAQAQRLGLLPKLPSLALDNQEAGSRFIFPQDEPMTVESLATWFAQYKAGSLKPFVKSEPIPESNDAPVKVIVANTFKDIVYDETKDVLVEFYAPWCGHCKTLAPIWDELGSRFVDSPSVVIAKIDATANDVSPKLNIRGFPTIIYFPAGKKQNPVEYQGHRTLDDFTSFLNKHVSKSDNHPSEGDDHASKGDDHASKGDEHASKGDDHAKDEL